MNSHDLCLVYALPYLEQGGTEKHVLSLINYFQKFYCVYLLAPAGSMLPQFTSLAVEHYQFTRWDFNFAKGIFELYQCLKNIQQQVRIDLIHVHAAHELMLGIKLFTPQVPVIFTVHAYHGLSKNFSYWTSGQIANWCAEKVIAVCQTEADILRNCGLSQHKIDIIYNGIPTNIVSSSMEKVQADEIWIGTLARLVPDKGVKYLIDAFSILAKKYDNLRLVIAGDGEEKQFLEDLANSLGVSQRVTFLGYVSQPLSVIQSLDIFVLLSLQEGFSLAVLEAMSQGKPIVATAVGGTPEQIQDGRDGLLVQPRSVPDLVSALEKLIVNPHLRQELGQQGQASYQQHFTLESMLHRTAHVYEKVLTGTKSASR